MHKALKDMTFDELVREGVELELDAIVKGSPLCGRVRAVIDLAVRWAVEKTD